MHHVVKEKELAGMKIMVHVLQGKDLVARDRNLLGRRTTSDPFLQAYYGDIPMGKTHTVHKSLAPVWNETLSVDVGADEATSIISGDLKTLTLVLFDEDALSDNDPLGTVTIPVLFNEIPTTCWFPVEEGSGEFHCKDAEGQVEVMVLFEGKKLMDVTEGQELVLSQKHVELSVSYAANEKVQLDTSLIAVDDKGNVMLDESAYYGNLATSALQYSNYEGSDEKFVLKFEDVPSTVAAFYIVYSVGSQIKSFDTVQCAEVRFMCLESGEGMCRYLVPPALLTADATTLVLARIKRTSTDWMLTPIQDVYCEGTRDFGSLYPQLKSYSSDIVTEEGGDTEEANRVAILRRGGCINVTDYTPAALPECLAFSVSWEGAEGMDNNIDLDAAVIMLDKDMKRIDIVYYGELQSQDGSVNHTGGEREVEITLAKVSPEAKYLGFVVNSIGAQELNGTKKIVSRLYNAETNVDIANYTWCNSEEMEDRTAVVVACLSRGDDDEHWYYRIASIPALGERAHDNVDELQEWLDRYPLQAPSKYPSSDAAEMPKAVEVFQDEIPVPQMQMKHYL